MSLCMWVASGYRSPDMLTLLVGIYYRWSLMPDVAISPRCIRLAHTGEPCKNGWTDQDAVWGRLETVPVMCSRVSLPYRHGAVIPCWDPPLNFRRRFTSASSECFCVDAGHTDQSTTRRTTLGDRAFPVTAARAWNALPSSVRSASLLQFRRDLKMALFQSSYSSP